MTNDDLTRQITSVIEDARAQSLVNGVRFDAWQVAENIIRDVPLVGAAVEMREACNKGMGALGYTMGEHDLACQCEQCAAYLQLGNAISKLPKE